MRVLKSLRYGLALAVDALKQAALGLAERVFRLYEVLSTDALGPETGSSDDIRPVLEVLLLLLLLLLLKFPPAAGDPSGVALTLLLVGFLEDVNPRQWREVDATPP